jgi:hypothetical protein
VISEARVGPVRLRVERFARAVSVVGGETRVASKVETGTAATRPMLPTRVTTISTAKASLLATVPTLWCASVKGMRSGRDATA